MPKKKAPWKPKPRTKAKRRPRGSGTIFYSEARKVWVGRVPVGRKGSGKTLYAERSDPAQGELLKKLALARAPGPETTLGQFATRWLAEMEVRPNTRAGRTNTFTKYVLPALGGMRLVDLTPHVIERTAAGWVAREECSANTAALMVGHLQTCLREAVRQGLRADNPAALSRKPKTVKRENDLFSPAELTRIITLATARRGARIWALVAATGMRSGEALALDCGDFDPHAGTIRITKTYGQRGGMGPPKSPHSVRTIRVPASAIPALRAARGSRTHGPLFRSERGRRYFLPIVRAAWMRLLKSLDLAERNPHVLRHSWATLALARGVAIADVAKYLGDTAATVVKTYCHPTGADPSLVFEAVLGGV